MKKAFFSLLIIIPVILSSGCGNAVSSSDALVKSVTATAMNSDEMLYQSDIAGLGVYITPQKDSVIIPDGKIALSGKTDAAINDDVRNLVDVTLAGFNLSIPDNYICDREGDPSINYGDILTFEDKKLDQIFVVPIVDSRQWNSTEQDRKKLTNYTEDCMMWMCSQGRLFWQLPENEPFEVVKYDNPRLKTRTELYKKAHGVGDIFITTFYDKDSYNFFTTYFITPNEEGYEIYKQFVKNVSYGVPGTDGKGVSTDLKKTLDEYEKFIDDYTAFRASKDSSEEEKAKYLKRLEEMQSKLYKYDVDTMSYWDYVYYETVVVRCGEKLFNAGG